jgi:hypothetical protein
MTNILAVVVVVGLLQGKIIKPYPLSHPLFLVPPRKYVSKSTFDKCLKTIARIEVSMISPTLKFDYVC